MDVFEAMLGRRSVGKLGGEVAADVLLRLVEVAVRAPNHRLTRPWRFTILRGEARERLGAAWAQIARRETSLEGDLREAMVQREAQKPLRAPAILVVSARTDVDPVVAEEDYAATSAAVQNVLLGAHALGLGAIWRTGAMARRGEINAVLGLDPCDRIVAFVYIGIPTVLPPPAPAPQIDAVVRVLA